MIVRKQIMQARRRGLLDDIRSLLNEAGDNLSDAAERIGKRSRSTGQQVWSNARHAGEQASDYMDDAIGYVRARPRQTAAVGVAVGLIVLGGILLMRRNRH